MAKYEEIIERTVGLDLNDNEMCDEHYEDDSEYKYFTVTVSGQIRTYARNTENAEDSVATMLNIHKDILEHNVNRLDIEAEEPKKEGA